MKSIKSYRAIMDSDKIKLDSIEDALVDFREGKMIIVVDDEDRENEGDIIVAAEKITPEQVNFMLKNARGVLCAPITISRCKELGLDPQVNHNTSVLGTPFTITVDKLEGCTTGVSIHDRCATIRALADPASTPETFGRPGHINPLFAQDAGVLRRSGHTEAAVDLARLAGLPSTVVNRAKKILRQLEEEAGRPAPAVQAQEDQVSLTALSEGEVIDQLRRTQVDTLSPLEALNLLYELKKKLN